jgi:hypothetical protein
MLLTFMWRHRIIAPHVISTCCISNALDRSEDDILWEDDGEDKDDSDRVADNDTVMSDDGESDE